MKHTNADLDLVPHAPFRRDGITHPSAIFDAWTREEKAAIALSEVVLDVERRMCGGSLRDHPAYSTVIVNS